MFGLFKNRTVVALRTRRTPVSHWKKTVQYDAWGTPYVETEFGPTGSYGVKVLRPDGDTDDSTYDTEWRHVSGPPVDFDRQVRPTRGDWTKVKKS